MIYLVGRSQNDIACSEYLHKICGIALSPAPYFNLEEEFRLHQAVSELIARKLIISAHDVSEGGLYITLAECAFNRSLGFEVNSRSSAIRPDAFWLEKRKAGWLSPWRPAMRVNLKRLCLFPLKNWESSPRVP